MFIKLYFILRYIVSRELKSHLMSVSLCSYVISECPLFPFHEQVIIVEPFFDCYQPMVKMAGGTAIYVPLKPVCSYIM